MLRPRPAIEARLTIAPRRCSFIAGTTSWVNRNVPDRLKSISFCQSAKLSSSTGAPGLGMIVLPPTALTRMSIAPNSCSTEATVASTSVSSSALHRRRCARPPLSRNSATVRSSRSSLLSTATTTAPSLPANRGEGGVEPLLIVIAGDDARALARHDVGGGATDAARRRGNQRDLVLKAHRFPRFPPAPPL